VTELIVFHHSDVLVTLLMDVSSIIRASCLLGLRGIFWVNFTLTYHSADVQLPDEDTEMSKHVAVLFM
jgi:hypothetical protein